MRYVKYEPLFPLHVLAIVFALAVAFAISRSAPAAAQTPSSTRNVAPRRAYDIVQPGDCGQPALPAAGPVPWVLRADDKLSWCVDGTYTAAVADTYKAYLDDTVFPLLKACLSNGTAPQTMCLALPPPALLTKAATTGPHRLEVTRTTNGVESPRSLPFLFETPGCRVPAFGATPSLTDTVAPIGTPLGQRAFYSSQDVAKMWALMRNAGWDVPVPQRVPYDSFSNPASGDGGWFFVAQCATAY